MNSGRIIDACEAEFPDAHDDCSLFVRRVCARLGVVLEGNADSIVTAVRGTWRLLPNGAAAKRAADAGALVIAGLKGSEQVQPSSSGHVAVVVRGPLAQGAYPTAYWGQLGGTGAQGKTINWAWQRVDRDLVTYGAKMLDAMADTGLGRRLAASVAPTHGSNAPQR